ncbi:SUKH-3 domain-containing protein [Streptomyces longispororuber]|uniref:SUKH-3 domain-containing protein n=1 Tax=Streptomyces longispororuber TaxID=68230 RepID=UPI00210A8D37|nr:SUKH-3 domain-containing protein [Streptomyces longispororuber]MCQ4208439.1 SUKH-3 domain-containing protein [Streptomyces longispororuber]
MTVHRRTAERTGPPVGGDGERDALRAALRLAAAAEGYAVSFPLFPAARAFLSEFHGLDHAPVEPGAEVAAAGFSIDPERARFQLVRLSRLSAGLRIGLFPVGVTENGSVLAIGEEGQLLSFGPGGSWHLGDSGPAGVEALRAGRAPRRLRDEEHTWHVPATTDDPPVTRAVQTALTAVYVLHRHGIYSARSVRLTVTGLRGIGVDLAAQSVGIRRGQLDAALSPMVRDVAEVLAAHGGGAGCEVGLAVEVPGTRAGTAAGLVRFRVRFGHQAMQADGLEADLHVGAGAQTGSVHGQVVDALRDLRQMS